MARIFKRGEIYWAWGYDRYGKRWQRSTKQRDKNAAKTVASDIERELALDADQPRDEACTLESALGKMIDHAERSKRSEDTIEFLTTKARHCVRLLGRDTRCSKLDLDATMAYMHTRLDEGASLHTVQKELRVLVQALRLAVKMGRYRPKVDPSALRPSGLENAYVPRERWLTVEDYQRLLAELDPARTKHPRSEDRRDYVIMYCQTGARLSELFGMQHAHVDRRGKIWHLHATKTRDKDGSQIRPIPLTDAALEAIERRWGRETLFPAWGKVQRDLDLACLRIEAELNPGWARPAGKKAHGKRNKDDGTTAARRNDKGQPPRKRDRIAPPYPFPSVTPNDLRRTFASWLAQNGVPLHHAAKLMGHNSTSMLQRVYARLAPETLRAAVAKLPEAVTGGSQPPPPATPTEPQTAEQPRPNAGQDAKVYDLSAIRRRLAGG